MSPEQDLPTDRPAPPKDQPLRGVIFDMDGVLCDSEPFICEAAMKMFAERYDTEVRPEDFHPFVGAGEDRYIGGVAEKYGIDLDPAADKARTYEIYLQIIQGRLDPLPGAVSFIDRLAADGIRRAVATAADRVKMEGNLRQIGIPPERFDAIVTGSDVQRKKPHPDGFELAAARLELPAGHCLVVEDAVNGVRAARAAGSRCLGLTTSFEAATLRDAGAEWTAPDLAHVPDDLLELL